jgi:glycine dehydrogenase subunit 1
MNLPEPLTEWELNGHMDCMAASMGTPPFYKVFMGAGSYHHTYPRNHPSAAAAQRVLHRLHPLSAGNQPGHPADHLRVPDPGDPFAGNGRGQCLHVRRRLGTGRSPADDHPGVRRKKVAVSAPFTPCTARWWRPILPPPVSRWSSCPWVPTAAPICPVWPTWVNWPAWPCRVPTSSAASRIWRAAGKVIHADKKTLFVTAFSEPLAYGLLKSPGRVRGGHRLR